MIKLIKKYKKIFFICLILFILLFFGFQKVKKIINEPNNKYEIERVKKEDLLLSVSASGEVKSEEQVTLQFQTPGKLAWVGVKEGDYVKKGQAIASLDKQKLEQDLKKELNDFLKTRWDFEQTFENYGKSGLPEEKWFVSEAIKRILQKAQFDLNNATIDVEIADLAVKLATIFSPIEGIVTYVESPIAGVNITPSNAKFVIANPNKMNFVVNIDEADIGKISIGSKTRIFLDAYPEEFFEGKVEKIAFAAITTRGGGIAFPTEISLPENINQRFKLGMNGDAEIIIEEKNDVITVSNEAIKKRGEKTFVMVLEGRKVKEVEITLGLEGEEKTEVLQGLSEGELVIIKEKRNNAS